MSAANASNKPSAYNEEIESLYDPYPAFSLSSSCSEPLWPEWSDADLNLETWDEVRTRASTVSVSRNTVFRPTFEDPSPPKLPPALAECVYSWKRPREAFELEDNDNESLTVYDPSNSAFELYIPSDMGREFEFFKVFMEEIKILQYHALKQKFQVELENANFVSTTQGEAWRPWHHVYALCKAGKGQVHKPLYCPYGKYVVRLYHMGAWRKFVVDDKIPCDVEGNPVFPLVKNSTELWPIILIKAMLKILSLTPTNHFFAADCPFLTMLTAWTHGTFFAKKSSDQVWERFLFLTPRYEQRIKSMSDEGKKDPSKTESRKDSRKEIERADPRNESFCFLMATLHSEELQVGCSVAIIMVRDCPLFKTNLREKTKSWKRIRWIQWAKEKGLWIDDTLLPPYRRLLIICFNPSLKKLLYPDPKLEAALYDIALEDVNDNESVSDNPEQWWDFFKFLDCVRFVNVYFKPSSFVGNFKISCMKQKTQEISSGGKVTSKAGAPLPNSFTFPFLVKRTCNEPIFLLCESNTGLFLFISLSVCPQKPKHMAGYLKADQPKLLKVGHGAVVVEVHDWRSCEQGEIVGFLKTVGTSSLNLNLRAGRYVLKIWLCADSPYVIDVYSNTNVYVNNSSRIRFLMSNEPQRILSYITNVSNAFLALTLKFGKPELPRALRDFYRAIRPGNDYIVGYLRKLDNFIETFLMCMMQMLKDLIPNAEEVSSMVGAMRSLFIDPYITYDPPKNPLSASALARLKAGETPLPLSFFDARRNKAIIIQKYFRRYRVRLLWKCQTPARKEFKVYNERLKKICDTIFVPAKRELEVGNLLRRIVMARPDLLNTFKFYEDFANVLDVEEFSGKMANVEPFAWVPITRFIIACHSEGLVPCFFHLSCNLERVLIQGFNNDTGEEIFRLSDNVSPHYYRSNGKGYTIVACGWNEANFKTVNWRLEIVKMKHFPAVHLCNLLASTVCRPYAMPSLEIVEIRNVYVPNSKSRICRCLIKIQRRTILTLRLSLSYSEVQFVLIISLMNRLSTVTNSSSPSEDNVVHKVISRNGVIIVPALILESVENPLGDPSNPTVTIFSVEAFVLNNSWPLTKQEWGLVEPLRVNGENGKESTTSLQSRRGRPESRKKLGRVSKRSITEQKGMDNPLWVVQVINDASGPEAGEPVVIEEDKSRTEYIKSLKASWREKDPGRRKRGKDMRMQFLYKMYLEDRKNRLCGEDEDPDEPCDLEVEGEDPQWVLERLSSLSYLISDTSPTRYTYSPRVLPNTPLLSLLCKYKKKVETESLLSSEITIGRRSYDYDSDVSFTTIRNMVNEVEEDRKDYSRQCAHYRAVLTSHISEELRLSSRLMEQAYEDRQKALESLSR